jgi:predicted RND superfamily exporter protein
MVPNLGPILLVFGILGWIGMSIDIGMMMTASIALGIAVDGTFHFLVIFKQQRKLKYHSERAAYQALLSTGLPIMQSAVIAACGMLALTASSFSPTIRFGWLMAILLLVAVVGDLVFLPALLAQLSPSPPPAQQGQQSSAAQHEASSRAA